MPNSHEERPASSSHHKSHPALHGSPFLTQKGVERLNSLQDTRQQFFADKMTQLMVEPHVIKILNCRSASKKDQMENKKIELEQRLSEET